MVAAAVEAMPSGHGQPPCASTYVVVDVRARRSVIECCGGAFSWFGFAFFI